MTNELNNNKYIIQSTTDEKPENTVNTKSNKLHKKEIFVDIDCNPNKEETREERKKRKKEEKEKQERKEKRREKKRIEKANAIEKKANTIEKKANTIEKKANTIEKTENNEKETNYYTEKKAAGNYSDFENVGFVEKKNTSLFINESAGVDVPKKYGSKWTDDDRRKLVNMLKNSSKIIVNIDENTKNNIFEYSPNHNSDSDFLIKKIADKLYRTEGGIRAEIKKIIFDDYTRGKTTEQISDNLNLTYKNVKSVIKIQLDKECDNEIILLEKENKLLKLKVENKRLKSELIILNN
jgi:hypothetical protein